MNEKLLEKKLREEVKKLEGLALKFTSSTYTGMPDRIVLMPKGKVYFVELKTTGQNVTSLQWVAIARLDSLEQDWTVIDDQQKLDMFLTRIAP